MCRVDQRCSRLDLSFTPRVLVTDCAKPFPTASHHSLHLLQAVLAQTAIPYMNPNRERSC